MNREQMERFAQPGSRPAAEPELRQSARAAKDAIETLVRALAAGPGGAVSETQLQRLAAAEAVASRIAASAPEPRPQRQSLGDAVDEFTGRGRR